jgi:8-oxo-dGTP diphosphatase
VSAERSVAGIVLKGEQVFAARRMPGGSLGGKWEFPGGKVERGESDREALAREFEEEFGARVQVGEFVGEGSFTHRGRERILSAYIVELEQGSELTPIEHAETGFFCIDELAGLDLAESDRKLLPYLPRHPRH